jgi:transposase-like protein
MVTITLRCQHCQSERLVRNALTADERQRYLCRNCGQRSREQPRSTADPEQEREQILRAYDERSCLRGWSRPFGGSRNMVTAWIKKGEPLACALRDEQHIFRPPHSHTSSGERRGP